MRMLLKFQMDTEAASRAIEDGTWGETMERLMPQLQPEAAYFTTEDGKRTGLIFFDLKEPSQLPSVAEPFFRTVKASIDFSPVMTIDEVRAGIQEAAKAF